MLRLFSETTSLLLALSMGMLAYRYMNVFLRLLLLQLIVWISFYTVSYALTSWQSANNLPVDNQWLMNLHLLCEAGLLLTAARLSFTDTFGKGVALTMLAGFLAVFAGQATMYGFHRYFNYADVAACISITAVYTLLLYTFMRNRTLPWTRSPEIIACLGLLVYFVCSVPYVAMMHYLLEHYPRVNYFLYHLISDILANVRYLLAATAFWLVWRNARSPIRNRYE